MRVSGRVRRQWMRRASNRGPPGRVDIILVAEENSRLAGRTTIRYSSLPEAFDRLAAGP